MKKLEVEILAPGKWNGIPFDRARMEEVVTNFTTFKELVQVYLKLGHNKEQKMTDGQPALGWVEALHINEAGKLVATFVDLPSIVYNALKKKLYRNVSIEALLDVQHKGEKYGTVLTAVALLGADMPAVNTLSDLQTYMSAGNELEFSARLELSAINGTLYKEDNEMTELEKALAEVERLKAVNEAQSEAIQLSATSATKSEAEIAQLRAAADKALKDAETAAFSARTDTVKADLESLVKAKVITPAKRDELTREFTAETADKVEFAISMFKELKPAGKKEEPSAMNGDGNENLGDTPDKVLHAKASALSTAQGISYSAAVTSIMESDPKLGREYIDQMGEV